MRLIDADNISFYCNYEGDCTGGIDDCKKCENYICNFRYIQKQPTAYDVDKVVEELESFSKLAEDRWTNSTSKYAYQEHKCWVKAIEIVKQGGVVDDVCEWEFVSNGEFIRNPHTRRTFSNEPSMKNVYCNTCGKKIKIVGD